MILPPNRHCTQHSSDISFYFYLVTSFPLQCYCDFAFSVFLFLLNCACPCLYAGHNCSKLWKSLNISISTAGSAKEIVSTITYAY